MYRCRRFITQWYVCTRGEVRRGLLRNRHISLLASRVFCSRGNARSCYQVKKENETLSFCRLTSSHASCYTRVIRAYIYTAITEFIAYQTRTDLSLLRSITARLPFDHAPIVLRSRLEAWNTTDRHFFFSLKIQKFHDSAPFSSRNFFFLSFFFTCDVKWGERGLQLELCARIRVSKAKLLKFNPDLDRRKKKNCILLNAWKKRVESRSCLNAISIRFEIDREMYYANNIRD